MLEYLNQLTTWPSIIIITSIILYFYSKRNHNYWKTRGIDGPEPLPFIGTIYQLFQKPICLHDMENYRKFGKIYGKYEGYKPVLFLAEPELIRDIFVRDFSTFVDRGTDSFGHPMFDRSIVLVRGDQWKQLRVIVSPTFSSSKMRKMKVLLDTCVQRLDQAMEKLVNTEISVRKLMGNYSMDVIALCAFATKLDTHNTDTGELHPFVKNANKFFTPSPRFAMFFMSNAIAPCLVRKFGITFVPSSVYNYFEKTLKQIISERQSIKGSKNLDLLQLLIDAKSKTDNKDVDEDIKQEVRKISESLQKEKLKLEEIDILSTSLFFLLGGSETTSSTLSYLFHELALNPEYQERLYQEINNCSDKQDYDTISQLPYLDACISETLRMYPPLVQTERTATDDYELGSTGIKIPKLMSIKVPVYVMHHDPKYFPDPEQYKPDRFMPENKSQIIPYTYLPFGTGPRNCVGMRFALMNIKTAVVHILSKYQFTQTPNTVTQFEYKKIVPFVQAIDMGTLGLSLRK